MSNTKQQNRPDPVEMLYIESPSITLKQFREAIDRLVTEAILEKLKSICQDNWQCFIPEKYMLDQIKELQSQLSDKDNK